MDWTSILSAFEPIDSTTINNLLFRNEEYQKDLFDFKGNFEAQHVSRRWDASLYKPVIDDFLNIRFPELKSKIIWPDGKRFAACLTHDIDTCRLMSHKELLRRIMLQIKHENRSTKKLKRALSITGLRHNPSKIDMFSPWIDAEKFFGFVSTFFVTSFQLDESHPFDNTYLFTDKTWYRGNVFQLSEVICDLAENGCEIGLHGSYHSATKVELLMRQKRSIENLIKQEIISSRQHNLHFDNRITPYILEKSGIKLDSTLGFNRDIGFRCATAYPHFLRSHNINCQLNVLEVPLIIHDCALLRCDNLSLNRNFAFKLCCKIIDRVAAVSGVVTILFHPESYFKPGWFDLYNNILTYIQINNGWGTSAKNIYNWWTTQKLSDLFCETISKVK